MATVYLAQDIKHDRKVAIKVLRATGGRTRMMVRLDNPNWQSIRPFFATDGRRFYFPVEDRESDIYVAALVAR